jgi:hypothetical protein
LAERPCRRFSRRDQREIKAMTCLLFAATVFTALPSGPPATDAAVRLTVGPMPAPKPALKFQLLPEMQELNPGNAAYQYQKCFMERRRFFYGKKAVADRARYQALPLAELPLDQLRDYGGPALRQADWAARLDTVDWQELQRLQKGGLGQLPAEVGPLQVLAAALHVRLRVEVARRQFAAALRTAKTMFALSRHLGEHPSEVGNLVGLWVAHTGLGALEEMVEQPGCPNLYWALTDLPSPLVDLRKGTQGERTLVAAELRMVRADAPMTRAEIDHVVSHFTGLMSFARAKAGKPPRAPRTALQARGKDAASVRSARRRLIEAGCAEDLVNRFPALQVILLEDKREFEIQRDERLKLLALPLWQIDSPALSQSIHQEREGGGLFAPMLPDIVKLRRTQGRLEQQIALLRHVEALRLYAAQHKGKLPAKLADVPVPLPTDPVTGKPFAYLADGATAHVRGPVPPGDEKNPGYQVHYCVTIRK